MLTAIIDASWKVNAYYNGSLCRIYRVTGEALLAETAVWPNLFLINVLFVLKGS